MPTASAVVADLIDTAVGRTRITFKTLELWSSRAPRVTLGAHANVQGRFYLRFTIDDHPGVLSQLAGILGRYEISIASVIQHESGEEADHGISEVTLYQKFYGEPESDRNAARRDTYAFKACVLRPLEWAGLLMSTQDQGA